MLLTEMKKKITEKCEMNVFTDTIKKSYRQNSYMTATLIHQTRANKKCFQEKSTKFDPKKRTKEKTKLMLCLSQCTTTPKNIEYSAE